MPFVHLGEEGSILEGREGRKGGETGGGERGERIGERRGGKLMMKY